MDKIIKFIELLTSISDKEIEEIRTNFYEVHIKRGDFFFQKGKICKQVAFINSGSFRMYYLNEKFEEITHCFRSKNTFFTSYKSFICQEPSVLSIVALEDSSLLVIDYDKLQRLYNSNIVWQKVGRLLAERAYIEMEQYASVLNNELAKAKYLRLLNEQPEILQIANVEHVATYLGVTRRTLSRIRQEISK